jgi:hypothetical protein
MSQLLEHGVAPESARLLDFVVREYQDQAVEVLLESPGDSVQGWLYRGLDGEDIRRLDAYNGIGEDLYRRRLCQVESEGRETVRAWAYLPTDRTLQRCFS